MKKFITLTLAALLLSFSRPQSVAAKVMGGSEGKVVIAASEIVNDDLWVSGQEVAIDGVVEGDLYVAGESISIKGSVTGDVFAAGSKIVITGKIGQDLYAAGENIEISHAVISDSSLLAGAMLKLDSASRIGGSLLAAGATINNDATITRSLMLAGGSLANNAAVLGEARLAGRDIRLGEKSNIMKDLNYLYDDEEGSFVNQGKVGGSTHQALIPAEYKNSNERIRHTMSQAGKGTLIIGFFAAIASGLFLLWLLRKPFEHVSVVMEKNLFKSIWVGLLVAILTPIVLLIPLFSGIATPLALMLFALYFTSLYLAKLIASLVLGRAIIHTFGWNKVMVVGQFLIGLAALFATRLIPVGGQLVFAIATWAGVGSLWLSYRK